MATTSREDSPVLPTSDYNLSSDSVTDSTPGTAPLVEAEFMASSIVIDSPDSPSPSPDLLAYPLVEVSLDTPIAMLRSPASPYTEPAVLSLNDDTFPSPLPHPLHREKAAETAEETQKETPTKSPKAKKGKSKAKTNKGGKSKKKSSVSNHSVSEIPMGDGLVSQDVVLQRPPGSPRPRPPSRLWLAARAGRLPGGFPNNTLPYSSYLQADAKFSDEQRRGE